MDRLGKRIAASSGPLEADDRVQFASILSFYQTILDDTAQQLIELGFRPTSRVKTTSTLAEKLRREHGIQLTRINDIAGLRIVTEGSRRDQDLTTQKVVARFSSETRPPLTIDRRTDPRQGYRAVHIVVFRGGYPVEIQIRTKLQDSWAQIFERTADQWGRQIRYGEPLDEPSTEVILTGELLQDRTTRAKVLELLDALSDAIANYEREEALDEELTEANSQLGSRVAKNKTKSTSRSRSAPFEDAAAYRRARSELSRACRRIVKDRRKRNRIFRRHFPSNFNSVDLTLWAQGVHKLTSASHELMVRSRPAREQAKIVTMAMLQDLTDIDESEAGP